MGKDGGGTAPMKLEWRCKRCGKLLGVVDGVHLHIRFARGHEYFVSLPVTSICRNCGIPNELRDTTKAAPLGGDAG